jgi:hypothetical protein
MSLHASHILVLSSDMASKLNVVETNRLDCCNKLKSKTLERLKRLISCDYYPIRRIVFNITALHSKGEICPGLDQR